MFLGFPPPRKLARRKKPTAAMLALSLVGLGSVAERTVEDQAVGSAHRQLGKKDKGPCIPNWQRCNTPNVNSGSTECCSDGATAYSCQAITEAFSQCKPGAPPPPPPPPLRCRHKRRLHKRHRRRHRRDAMGTR